MQKILVKNSEEGIDLAKKKLYEIVDQQTLLFLSGGSTPKSLYESLAIEASLKAGAVAMVDERFGKPGHPFSNEKMIKETGLLSYLSNYNIRFYPILKGKDFESTAREYDELVRSLIFSFPKSIGIFGMGEDGHTAGIAPNKKDFQNPLFKKEQENLFVSHFDDGLDFESGFGKRITITFRAMEGLDILIVLVFGKNKKRALWKKFKDGFIEEIPARFFTRPEISSKTLLITDQKI